MRKSAIDVWVGIFVAIGLLAALFLALKVGNMNAVSFAPTYKISARFDNIGGLKPRAPVKSAGVVVGRIANISFDDKTYQATVVMTIEDSFKFPKDSSAKILTSGLLGEQYVNLEPGGSEDVLKNGSKIDITQSAIILEKVIGQFLFKSAEEKAQGDKKE